MTVLRESGEKEMSLKKIYDFMQKKALSNFSILDEELKKDAQEIEC